MKLVWPIRSVCAGAAGTATMTLAYAAERRLRHRRAPLDYDDSIVPGQIVASVMHLPHVTAREDHELGCCCAGATGPLLGSCTACCTGGLRSPGPVRRSAAR